jgi:hypothetical protein
MKLFCYLSFIIVFNLSSSLLFFLVLVMCLIFILIIVQFWTDIFSVLQMNTSRNHTTPIMTEYFVDHEKYFYFILLYTNIAICVAFMITIAIGTMFITFFQHINAMFKIARYIIKNRAKTVKITFIICIIMIYMYITVYYLLLSYWTFIRHGYIRN